MKNSALFSQRLIPSRNKSRSSCFLNCASHAGRIMAVVSNDINIKRRKSSRTCFQDEFSIRGLILLRSRRQAGWQINASEEIIECNQKCYTYLSVRMHRSVVDEDSLWCAISLLLSIPLAFCIFFLTNHLYLSIYLSDLLFSRLFQYPPCLPILLHLSIFRYLLKDSEQERNNSEYINC